MDELRSLRYQGKHIEAWAIYKTIDLQSEGAQAAKAFLAYERSILSYYVGVPKEEALLDFITSYSLYKNIDYVNLQFYVVPFPSTILPFSVSPKDEFLPTSTSILRLSPTKLLLNVRYVNYRITENGTFLMSEGGVLAPHHFIRTRNVCLLTNNEFVPIEEFEMVPRDPPTHIRNICGLEDIRLFRKDYQICFSATSCEYSHNGLIQEVEGVYDIESHTLVVEPMHSPTDSRIEKNWIPVNRGYGDSLYIYSWHPLIIGKVKKGIFTKKKEVETPTSFAMCVARLRVCTIMATYMQWSIV